jgi:hypothetical protein
MSASTSDNWTPRRSPSPQLAAAGVVLLLVALGGAFYWLEQDRSRKQIEESMHVHRNADGMIDLVRFETDVVTQRHWEELQPAAYTMQTLHLSRTTSVAGGLAAVSGFPNLETLFLLECAWVDDQQLQHLAGLKLGHLNLAKTPVTDRGLAAIDLSRLRILDLGGCEGITDAGLDQLHDGVSLTNVLLEGTSLTLDGFERLRLALPEAQLHLKKESLLQTFCKLDGGSPWLENRQQVDTLLRFFALPHNWSAGTYSPPSGAPFMTLKGPAVGPALADILAAMPNSNTVMLSQTSIPGGFEAASDAVKRLELGHITGPIDLSSLASMKSLESLGIHSTTVPEAQLAVLTQLPSLKVLSFYNSEIPDGEFKWLPQLPSLELVELGGITVTESDLLEISECEALRGVIFSRMEVSDEVAEAVAALPNLTHLTLYQTSVSPEIIEMIRARYPDLQLRAD